MKRILWLCVCLLLSLCAVAQTQQGYVKTKGRKGSNGAVVPGKRIAGATIQVKAGNAVVTQGNGAFSFPVPTHKFNISNVRKQGYVLIDPEVLVKQYVYSSNPLILVMETPEQQTDDKLASERKIRRTLQRKLQAREDEIEDLKEQNKMTREEYQKALQQLYAEQETNEKLIGEMAERYSQIDYDLLDEFNGRISDCILEGRLAEADSLLRSKGDIKDRIAAIHQAESIEAAEAADIAERQQRLEQSKAGTRASKEDVALDCYHFYEKFKLEHNNDSAAYYLSQRVMLDSTRVVWLSDAGRFASDYMADYPRALDYFQRALRHAISQQGEETEFVAEVYNHLGMICRRQGKFDEAMEHYRKALAICKKSLGDDHVETASTLNNIGRLLDDMGDAAQAREYYLKSLDINERVLGPEHLATAASYNNLASLYYSSGDYARAMEFFASSLAIKEKKLENDHPDLATSYSNIGSVYNAMGDHAHALEYFSRALDIRQRVLGKKHPDVAITLSNIGMAHLGLSDFDKALESYMQAADITQKVLGDDHSDVAICYNNIGLVYQRQRNNSSALEWYGKSLNVKLKTLGENHPSTINTLENMGGIYFASKDYAHARDCYARAMSARLSSHADEKEGLADSYDNMGAVLYHEGDYVHSLEHLLHGAAIREQLMGSGDHSTARTYKNVARTYSKLSDFSHALEYYQKACDVIEAINGDGNNEVVSLKKDILKCQYQVALSRGKLKAFMADHCLVATVSKGDNPAVAQGMSGEYVVLEFARWNQESTISLFDMADELRQSPKDLVLWKDGVISCCHFENRLGLFLDVKQLTKEEKQKINKAYKLWKEQNKK